MHGEESLGASIYFITPHAGFSDLTSGRCWNIQRIIYLIATRAPGRWRAGEIKIVCVHENKNKNIIKHERPVLWLIYCCLCIDPLLRSCSVPKCSYVSLGSTKNEKKNHVYNAPNESIINVCIYLRISFRLSCCGFVIFHGKAATDLQQRSVGGVSDKNLKTYSSTSNTFSG